MGKNKFMILSPDGFDINIQKIFYEGKEITSAIQKFIKRYNFQGYYSSNKGRIELDDLINHIKIVPVEIDEDDEEQDENESVIDENEVKEAIRYFEDMGFIDELTSDKRYYVGILIAFSKHKLK